MIAGKASSEKSVSRSGNSPRSATHVERWTYCVSSESGRTRKRERVASPAAQPSAASAPGQAWLPAAPRPRHAEHEAPGRAQVDQGRSRGGRDEDERPGDGPAGRGEGEHRGAHGRRERVTAEHEEEPSARPAGAGLRLLLGRRLLSPAEGQPGAGNEGDRERDRSPEDADAEHEARVVDGGPRPEAEHEEVEDAVRQARRPSRDAVRGGRHRSVPAGARMHATEPSAPTGV